MSEFSHSPLNESNGFTIIELLIATLVFSMVLLVATFGVIQIGKTYVKGYISSQTQNTSRSIIDELSQAIQLSGNNSVVINTSVSGWVGICVSTTRYTAELNSEVTPSSPHALFRDVVTLGQAGTCTPNTTFSGSGTELLSQNERLTQLSVTKTPICNGSDCLYQINLGVLYGNNDVTTGGKGLTCLSYQYGGEFCGLADTSTTVEQRS